MDQKPYTRAEYLRAPASEQTAAHRRYYGQFVGPRLTAFVVYMIGAKAIRESTDEHLNDIRLSKWDALHAGIMSRCAGKVGDVNGCIIIQGRRQISYSLSDSVCIAKEAARQWRELERQVAADAGA